MKYLVLIFTALLFSASNASAQCCASVQPTPKPKVIYKTVEKPVYLKQEQSPCCDKDKGRTDSDADAEAKAYTGSQQATTGSQHVVINMPQPKSPTRIIIRERVRTKIKHETV